MLRLPKVLLSTQLLPCETDVTFAAALFRRRESECKCQSMIVVGGWVDRVLGSISDKASEHSNWFHMDLVCLLPQGMHQ